MPAIRKKVDKEFTIVQNKLVMDKELPFAAKGLLILMLALPDDWHFSIAGLQAICAEGQDKISSTLKLLEKHGYLRRVKKIGRNGSIIKWEYYFSDEPIFIDPKVDIADFDKSRQKADENPSAGIPSAYEPSMENPDVETVPIYKELNNKELIDKELINKLLITKKDILCGEAAQSREDADEIETDMTDERSVSDQGDDNKIKSVSPKKKDRIPVDEPVYEDIVSYLNDKAHTNYKSTTDETRSLISARIKDGYSIDDIKTVIDRKCAEWLGTDMAQYLRPQTLFGSKFESYLNATSTSKNGSSHGKQKTSDEPKDYSISMIDLLNEYLSDDTGPESKN